MLQKRIVWLLTAAAVSLSLLCGVASAAEVESGAVYCFQTEDFAQSGELTGICITDLPDVETGTVMLGGRILRPGDILTVDQLEKLTFSPLQTQHDAQAVMSYLPIFEDRVEKSATVTVSIRGREDKNPVAVDSSLETYKNLPNTGKLKVSDPEGKDLTYTVTRQPKRGTLTVVDEGREDVPRWAAVAVTALQDSGVTVQAMETLTRGEAAKLLYQISLLAEDAPGLKMYR